MNKILESHPILDAVPGFKSGLGFLFRFLLTLTLEGAGFDHVSATHVRHKDGFLNCWLKSGSTLALLALGE